jgi:metal-responsive CopG/Arc/MetJ family transcriptional regulator
MKVAISLPDDVYEAAEVLAKERGIPRSRIYVLALRSYLEQQRGEKIMEEYNEYYANEKAVIDPVLKKLQAKALRHSEW